MIIGTHNDLRKVKDFPIALQKDIESTIAILDNCYGVERNVLKDDGGFVVIADNISVVDSLLTKWKIDIKEEIYEYSVKVDDYIKKLFIISSDFAIVVYIKENLI